MLNLRHWPHRQWMACLLFIPSIAGAAPFAYITNGSLPGTVSVIDTAYDTVVNTIAVGVDPSGVAVSATGTRVYVSNSLSSSVSVIDATTNTVVATVPGIAGPRGVAVNPAGTRAYVGHVGPTSVAVIDTATNSIAANIPVSGIPLGLAMNATGTVIYVVGADTNVISVIDVATNTVVTTVAVASPAFVAVNPAGTRVYVTDDASNSVAIIDTATNTVVGSVGVGAEPAGVAVNPAGTRVYVANAKSDSVSVIDSVSNAVIATVPVGKYPGGLAVNPAGTRIYVANTNSNNVSVIDATSNAVIATIPVGQFPVAFGQFIGPAVGPPTAVAVEYYYSAWNFYFETSFPDEIAALDGGAFGGAWKRTGQTFQVWPQSNPSASPTCRFFSTAFAPKSSHFYTPFPAECAVVKTNPNWEFESIAFYIALADANGLCPVGTIPLYRAYNNGMGGAPNHRYTTSLMILNQMIAAGWVFEGNGNTMVFACVPQ